MDINVIAAVLGMVVTLWGITWKMSKDTDRKIGKMFSRFDEFKEHMEITHTRREVCDKVQMVFIMTWDSINLVLGIMDLESIRQ